jgi:DNA-binding response OmpR family regulator
VGDALLLVEDDAKIGQGVSQSLEHSGYIVEWVRTGAAALASVEQRPPAVVLLDLGLPDGDGLDVCSRIRTLAPRTAIIMLTARTDEIDIIIGLDAGADDYVTKPFQLGELLARVRAHLRRPSRTPEVKHRVGNLIVDVPSRRVSCGACEVELRPREFELLTVLMEHVGYVLTRERIMELVWDERWFGSTKTLDMHISALRRKLGTCDCDITITTLRGVGYRMERGAE